jgi:chromosomal replication initiation ATPase DnaA
VTDARPALSPLLAACVARGVVDESTAAAIEAFRESSGLGLAESLREFGIAVQAAEPPRDGTKADGYAPFLLPVPPDPALTFDSFVACAANARALQAARRVLDEPGAPGASPFCVLGQPGVGKTHLLSAMVHAAGPGRALLVHVTDLDVEVERARRGGERAALRRWLVGAELLLLDDVHLLDGQPGLQHEVLALIEHRARAGRPLVCSSARPWGRLEGFEPALASRLEAAAATELRIGDAAERAEILRRTVKGRSLPGPVVDYLALQVGDSIRRLKSAATQLLGLVQGTGLEVDLEMARAVVPLASDFTHTPTAKRRSSAPPVKRTATAPPAGRPISLRPPSAAKATKAQRFKEMLAGAETPEEQGLALEIAVSERLRQLRRTGGEPRAIARLERALELLREGKLADAVRRMEE